MPVEAATAVEFTLEHINKEFSEDVLMNVALSDSWIALQQTQCDSFPLT